MIEKILENLIETGVESAGEQAKSSTFQRLSVGIVLVLSAWITISSAFLWQSTHFPGISGLLQLVASGKGPLWLLAVPLFGALATVLTLVPITGRFTAVAIFSAATFGFGLGALAYIQGGDTSALTIIDATGVPAAIVLPIFALVLTIGDIPALDSPMARFTFVYSGRLKHLRALRQFGLAHRWQVKEPQNRNNALTLTGNYDDEHAVTITSSATYKLSTSNSFSLSLSIKMTSPANIIAFRISYDNITANLRKKAIAGECRQRFKRTIKFFIIPEPGQTIGESFTTRFAEVVEAGRPYLNQLDFVVATPSGLRYTHKTTGLTTKDVQRLDALLQWLQTLVQILEEISPRANNQPKPSTLPQ